MSSVVSTRVYLSCCKILCNVAQILFYFPEFQMLSTGNLNLLSLLSISHKVPTCFTTRLVLPTNPLPLVGSLPLTPVTFFACVLLMTWVFVNFLVYNFNWHRGLFLPVKLNSSSLLSFYPYVTGFGTFWLPIVLCTLEWRKYHLWHQHVAVMERQPVLMERWLVLQSFV